MTRHDRAPRAAEAPLIEGPRWYKRRIRTLGPLFGLIPMIVLGTIAFVVLELFDSRLSGTIGLILGSTAAPGLLVVGGPFGDESNFPLAILLSAPMWIVLGSVAAFRATRRPVASWADYARELFLLTLAAGAGAVAAVFIAAAIVGQSLFL